MNNGNIEQLREKIKSQDKTIAYGGRTKTALVTPEEIPPLDLSEIQGILEYQPDEYTFTAYAGTRLADIDQMLADHGQFMPFDPPFIKRGGTLGGTVAANLSGPGRYRYGGMRDFIIGVKFLDFQGRLIRAGGKVVKNAAGFDISKLMVGSLGSLGAIVELSFKVFPRPPAYVTGMTRFLSFDETLSKMESLASSPLELYCLEIEPLSEYYRLVVRLGGVPDIFPKRIERLQRLLSEIEILEGVEEKKYWQGIREFSWVSEDSVLIKVPITPTSVSALEKLINRDGIKRRYSAGANVAWISWPEPVATIGNILNDLKLSGLSLLGNTNQIRLGCQQPNPFYQRIKNALDPVGKWVEI